MSCLKISQGLQMHSQKYVCRYVLNVPLHDQVEDPSSTPSQTLNKILVLYFPLVLRVMDLTKVYTNMPMEICGTNESIRRALYTGMEKDAPIRTTCQVQIATGKKKPTVVSAAVMIAPPTKPLSCCSTYSSGKNGDPREYMF